MIIDEPNSFGGEKSMPFIASPLESKMDHFFCVCIRGSLIIYEILMRSIKVPFTSDFWEGAQAGKNDDLEAVYIDSKLRSPDRLDIARCKLLSLHR